MARKSESDWSDSGAYKEEMKATHAREDSSYEEPEESRPKTPPQLPSSPNVPTSHNKSMPLNRYTRQVHTEILITTSRQIQRTTFPLKVRNQPCQLIKLQLAEDVKAHFIDSLQWGNQTAQYNKRVHAEHTRSTTTLL